MFRLVVFEVQIQRDQGPIAMIPVPQRLLDDGTDAIEEVMLHGRLVPAQRLAMRDDRPALASLWVRVPGKILFNRERGSRRQCPIDPIAPPLEIWVAVVRVHEGARTGCRHALCTGAFRSRQK